MVFNELELDKFWNNCAYSLNHYVMDPPSEKDIKYVEQQLGYKLPQSYIELMKMHNGGLVKRNCFVLKDTPNWSPDHIIVTGILGIGNEKTYSLCGTLGSRYLIEQCGYPDKGIYVCDTPAGDEEAILLDYSLCGKNGEPRVLFVDKSFDYQETVIAKNFETFLKGLVLETSFENDEDDDEIDDEDWIEEEFMD